MGGSSERHAAQRHGRAARGPDRGLVTSYIHRLCDRLNLAVALTLLQCCRIAALLAHSRVVIPCRLSCLLATSVASICKMLPRPIAYMRFSCGMVQCESIGPPIGGMRESALSELCAVGNERGRAAMCASARAMPVQRASGRVQRRVPVVVVVEKYYIGWGVFGNIGWWWWCVVRGVVGASDVGWGCQTWQNRCTCTSSLCRQGLDESQPCIRIVFRVVTGWK